MPLNIPNTPIKFPQPSYLTLSNFKRGVITLIDRSRLPQNALEEADNIFLYEDGQPGPRPGVGWYGSAPGLVAGGSSASISPSASVSSSSSPSLSPSASVSPSASRSPSSSVSPSTSPSASLSPSASISPSHSLSPSSSVSPSVSPSSSLSPSASASGSPSSSQSPSTSLSPSASTSPSPSASPSSSVSLSISPSASVSASPSAGNASQIDGFDYFDASGTIHLVAAAGGIIYRSLNNAVTWTACSGARYTPGTDVYMNQNGSYLYITNGTNNIIRYDGSTTLQTYTALTTPSAITIAETGLTTGSFTYYYKCAAVNAVGFSAASVKVTQTTNKDRGLWDSSNYLTLTLPSYQGTQTRFDIYISTDDISYFYLDSVTTPTLTYIDNGTAIIAPGTLAPTQNTTQGPLVTELTNVGDRQYGVRDTNNPYRIWFTGTGTFSGAFSSAYDGGYLDWQPGGKLYPVKVVDYRDGKGTPLATVFCKSGDGQGCVIQMSLDTLTIGDISITVPSAYRLPGSRGTPAPNSVVNVLNDFYFYNSQAFYNLGSRAQFLNLLSTDEASANIRPTVKQISTLGESKITAIYYFARVYFSVPYGSSTNNYTAIYDTERQAWLPKAFTVGFKKFLRYTDTNGTPRLLALKPGDSMLSEISDGIAGDYGSAFSTSLVTGLYPTTKDRFDFQYVEEGEVEFSNPQGDVNAELLGIERTKGYTSLKNVTISVSASVMDVGWDTFNWDSDNWDDTTETATVFSESSIKRYFVLLKELNAVQWRITTNSLGAKYILRTLQTRGTPTQAGKPRQWRVN